jgi:hypothetical protein
VILVFRVLKVQRVLKGFKD